ncbi:ribonuclease HI [Zafaria sp. Z1313]|uniref:ribonuclease HI n=1 Tax=Zafaria sp. Z1313 TaxID=3423202 RepID=UPI003D3031F9
MQHPIPAPPAHRYIPAFREVASRDGIAISVGSRRGLAFWSVALAVGGNLVATRTGRVVEEDMGPHFGRLHQQLDKAIRAIRRNAAEVVYCDEGGLLERLGIGKALTARGFVVSNLFPPQVAAAANEAAIAAEIASCYRDVIVSTDASAGTRGWTGQGWAIDFGHGILPRLGHQACRGRDVLEAELRAILFALKEAVAHVPCPSNESCAFTVRSDSQLAVRMLQHPGWAPERATLRSLAIVDAIFHQMKGLPLRVEWVKGHNGDAGNELADRMAVMARRSAEAGLTPEQVLAQANSIRSDAPALGARSGVALAA